MSAQKKIMWKHLEHIDYEVFTSMSFWVLLHLSSQIPVSRFMRSSFSCSFFSALSTPKELGTLPLWNAKRHSTSGPWEQLFPSTYERDITLREQRSLFRSTLKKKTRENVFYSSTCWNTAFANIRTILILLAKIWLKRSISPLLKLMGGKRCGLVPTRLNEGTNRWRLLYTFETCLENEVSRNDNAVKWTTWPTNGLNFSANTSESRQQQKKKTKLHIIESHCLPLRDRQRLFTCYRAEFKWNRHWAKW